VLSGQRDEALARRHSGLFRITIADSFDAAIAMIVPLAIALALTDFDPQVNIRSLRELRG
jgi:hypothetical protein